jgi:hypothetical protein
MGPSSKASGGYSPYGNTTPNSVNASAPGSNKGLKSLISNVKAIVQRDSSRPQATGRNMSDANIPPESISNRRDARGGSRGLNSSNQAAKAATSSAISYDPYQDAVAPASAGLNNQTVNSLVQNVGPVLGIAGSFPQDGYQAATVRVSGRSIYNPGIPQDSISNRRDARGGSTGPDTTAAYIPYSPYGDDDGTEYAANSSSDNYPSNVSGMRTDFSSFNNQALDALFANVDPVLDVTGSLQGNGYQSVQVATTGNSLYDPYLPQESISNRQDRPLYGSSNDVYPNTDYIPYANSDVGVTSYVSTGQENITYSGGIGSMTAPDTNPVLNALITNIDSTIQAMGVFPDASSPLQQSSMDGFDFSPEMMSTRDYSAYDY